MCVPLWSACRVVICGGGIIGAATAYYLSQQGVGATVVEREALAAAASGKAGGFLALDWNDSSPVGPLARCAALGPACRLKRHTYCITTRPASHQASSRCR